MKKVLLLLMASLMVTVFVGCSDDDIIINDPIVGHWQSVSQHQYLILQETGETSVTEEKPYTGKYMEFYENGKCKCDNSNIISNYTIVDNILDIHGSGNVGNKENPITIIVRGNYLIEELSNDKMVLRETGYGYSYVNKVYGEPPVCYETHWTYTFKKVSE